ncbi:hypothetical protein ACFTWF_32540 [Rhodococcus sp. NPDC056960]|uniref:hypothetical protein n=1 Tax=Rhodococcus sp. NPDC056960 TaxID=3345982 RepID=UPI0036298FE4
MLYVVTGPPAAGKSTYCRQHAQPTDVIIDFDLLANALTPPREGVSAHDHSDAVKAVAKAARQAAIDKALSLTGCDVYLIHSTPSAALLDRYRRAGAHIVTVDPGRDIVMSRCKAERPRRMLAVAAQWYDNQAQGDDDHAPRPARTTTEKGLGWQHQKQRDRLLRAHTDGTACWWCDQPMYRDKTRNHDGEALAADHTHARANGGTTADRLLHGRCNKERGKGDRDHLRPALAAQRGGWAGNSMTW